MDEKLGEITALKSLLADTDYQVIKSAEELLTCKSLTELLGRIVGLGDEIRETIRKRAQWRAKIGELEKEING